MPYYNKISVGGNMEKKNLYIDFDGVILDTITPLYRDYEEQKISKKKEQSFMKNILGKQLLMTII